MSFWHKEDVYDSQIAPLMSQIIAICEEHHMPIVCSIQFENDEQTGPGLCTTALTPKDWSPDEKMVKLNIAHQPQKAFALAETIETRPDGSKHITIRRRGWWP